jgi:hypothetical protein
MRPAKGVTQKTGVLMMTPPIYGGESYLIRQISSNKFLILSTVHPSYPQFLPIYPQFICSDTVFFSPYLDRLFDVIQVGVQSSQSIDELFAAQTQ